MVKISPYILILASALLIIGIASVSNSDEPANIQGKTIEKVFFKVINKGRLSISFFPSFKYDGKNSGGYGSFQMIHSNRARVHFSGPDLAIPPLQVVQGSNFARIEIQVKEMAGEIDFATGSIQLSFDATFTPYMGKKKQTPISVVTLLTTETSKGKKKKLTGRRMNASGAALLVGVAIVPKTNDRYINAFLRLPTDAACELPVHFEFVPKK